MVASVDDDLWWFVLIFYADGEDLFGSIMTHRCGKAMLLHLIEVSLYILLYSIIPEKS